MKFECTASSGQIDTVKLMLIVLCAYVYAQDQVSHCQQCIRGKTARVLVRNRTSTELIW